jgi:hypothetical protein
MPDPRRLADNAVDELRDAKAAYIEADAAFKGEPDDPAREGGLETASMRLGIAASIVQRDPHSRSLAGAEGIDAQDLQEQASESQARIAADRHARAGTVIVPFTPFDQRYPRMDSAGQSTATNNPLKGPDAVAGNAAWSDSPAAPPSQAVQTEGQHGANEGRPDRTQMPEYASEMDLGL